MQCRQCSEPVKLSLTGLGKFCSWECRKEWTNARKRANYAKTTKVSDTPISDSISPCNNGENNGSKTGSETDLINALGGKKWYDLAKKFCVNFDVRVREGFCSYLFDPKRTHKMACCRCELGQGLMRYETNRRLVKKK